MKQITKRILSYLLAFLVVFTTAFGNASITVKAEGETETIAAWNFTKDSAPAAGELNAAATMGNGTLSLSGANYAGGTKNNGLQAGGWNEGAAWYISSDATGYSNVSISFFYRGTKTAPAFFNVDVTTDGSSWNTVGIIEMGPKTDAVEGTYSYTLAGVDNSAFTVRIIDTNNAQIKDHATAAPAGGNINLNNVTIIGTKSGDVPPVIIDPTCADVTATPEAGAVAKDTEVTLSCETEGAQIYFNTDGTENFSVYENPVVINEATTITAFASLEGYNDSEHKSFEYTIARDKCETVTADVASGEVTSGTKVTLSCATEDAAIEYNTDGSENYVAYEEPIEITKNTKIYARATKEDFDASDVATFEYTLALGSKLEEINDGDVVALVIANQTLTSEKSGAKLKGVEAKAAEDGTFTVPSEAATLKFVQKEDGYFEIIDTQSGKYLTTGATGKALSFEKDSSGLALWKLEKNEKGEFFLINKEARYEEKEQAIEVYNGVFTAYSKATSSAFAVSFYLVEPKDYVEEIVIQDLSEIKNDDAVVLWCSNFCLTTTDTNNRLAGVGATIDKNGKLSIPKEAAVLKVIYNDKEQYYAFQDADSKSYLAITEAGNTLVFVDTFSDLCKWDVTALADGGFHVANKTVTKKNAIEYFGSYGNFTTYNVSDTAEFLVRFFETKLPVSIDTSMECIVVQWAGAANYPAENVTDRVYGDLAKTNDMMDTSAVYYAVVNGNKVTPYISSKSKGGEYSYYMGAQGVGVGTDDYMMFELSTRGFGNLGVDFRLRESATAPAGFQLQYSLDGVEYNDLTTGKYAYTTYSAGAKSGNINDGIAYGSLYSGNYIDFHFDIPRDVDNADKVYIRLKPTALSGKGEAIKSGGSIRIESVTVKGNPVVDDSICRMVKILPESGETAVNTELTMTSATEGATIMFSVDGSDFTKYEESNKPVIDTLPCIVRAYATKEGLTDSVVSVNSYSQSKVELVIATPNGGSVKKGTMVKLSTKTEGAKILYAFAKTDENTADEFDDEVDYDWQEYVSPIELDELPCTIVTKAVKEGFIESAVKTLSFTERTFDKYNIYFGQIHSHTNFSDGAGTCEEAFQHARGVENLDFLAVTDHSNSLDNCTGASIDANPDTSADNEWTKGHNLAKQYSDDTFTCLYGYEMTWSNGLGHMNTFNTPGFQSRTQTEYSTYATALNNYYVALNKVPDSISMFNHPGTTFGDFQDFAYYSEQNDALINLIEVGNGEGAIGSSGYFPSYEYYTRALDKGWHVAPTNNQDNHKGLWGDANTARTVVLAESNTEANIYDAMKNHRIYATEDNDLSIYYTLDGYEMGTILGKENVGNNVDINVDLSDATGEVLEKVSVIVNGGLEVASKDIDKSEEKVEFILPANYSYYYIKVVEKDGDIAVTAPVWVGEVEACGLNGVSTNTLLPVAGEPVDINIDFYNNEKAKLKVNKVTVSISDSEGKSEILETIEGDNLGDVTTISSNGTGTLKREYVYGLAGNVTYEIVVDAELNGVAKHYNGKLSMNYVSPAMVGNVIIDGTHANDYVSGYYGGNVTNFQKLCADKNLKAVVVTDKITADMLANCKLLVIAPPASKSGTSTTGAYKASSFDDEFVELVKNYVACGGNLVLTGIADYSNYKAATEQNKILEAIGADIRVNSDEVMDDVNNGGQTYRIYPSVFNMESSYCLGVQADKGQVYSQYSGCSISCISDKAEVLVSGFETTYSVDCKDEKGDSFAGGNVVNDNKGNVNFLVHQKMNNGSHVFVAGGVFFSDFEIKAELDNNDSLPYANYTIMNNILNENEVALETSTIADARKGAMSEVFAVEGYVTSGTDNASTTFFDTIYIEDETAGIDIFPYSEAGLELGTKVRIVGYVSEYQGDKELKVISSKILPDEKKIVEPKVVSTKDAMDYDALGGSLLKTTGVVTRRAIENGALSEFWIKDETGVEAAIFIDGYIYSGTTGKNTLADTILVGDTVEAVGVLYKHPEGSSDVSVPVFRVRNCDEIVRIKEGDHTTPTPAPVSGGSSSSSSSSTETAATPTATPTAAPAVATAVTIATMPANTGARVGINAAETVAIEQPKTALAAAPYSLTTGTAGVVLPDETVDLLTAECDSIVEQIVAGGTPKAKMSEETIANVKKAVEEGKEVTLKVNALIISANDIPAKDKELIDKAFNEKVGQMTGGAIMCIDLSLYFEADSENLGNVTELSEPITVTIPLPDGVVVEGKEFFVIRNHNGEIDILDVIVNEDGTISFKTDRFSVYTLCYVDKIEDTPVAMAASVEEAGGNSFVWLYICGIVVACGIIVALVILRNKREQDAE